MRKLLRAKMRHQAEKSTGKTIKVFRSMWKSYIEKRKPVKVTGTKAKQKKKSKLHKVYQFVSNHFKK